MSQYTFVTTPRLEAGLQAAVAAYNAQHTDAENPMSKDEYLAARLTEVLTSYADAHSVGVITPYAFVERFTPAEYARIVDLAATDPHVSGLLARLKEVDKVHLYSDEVQQGVSYLCITPAGEPILTAARAGAILS